VTRFRFLWLLALVLCLGLLLIPRFKRQSDFKPNIILITLDTTRADALGAYGNTQVHTPVMDALAASGSLFEQCYSQASLTLPSHSSILTGLPPYRHGVHNNSTYRLPDHLTTLPEHLQSIGYRTGAFIGSVILLAQYGLDQGFDLYDDQIVHYRQDQQRHAIVTRRAGETMRNAWEWIRRESQPFFSWIHLYDPHWPYEAPSPFLEAYADVPYYGELAYVDFQIGRLVNQLKEAGIWENTLLIITGDHGESFGEHDEQTHGFFVYHSTTHVPLIFSRPLNQVPGQRWSHTVESLDITPTILHMLGMEKEARDLPGKNLLTEDRRLIYSETYIPHEGFYCSPLLSLKDHRYSYYLSQEEEFYDRLSDPQELNNLLETVPSDLIQEFRQEMERIRAAKTNQSEAVQLNAEMIEMLKSLGYVQEGGTHHDIDDDPFALPSPKNSIGLYRQLQDLRNFEEKFPYKTIEGCLELRKAYPKHIKVLTLLGATLTRAGDDAALEALGEAAKLRPSDPRLHNGFGMALFRFGQLEHSLKEFTLALELQPDQLMARYNAARTLLEMGKTEDARRNFLKVLEHHPNDIFTLNNLAYLSWNVDKDLPAALQYLEKALQHNQKHPLLKNNYKLLQQERLLQSSQEDQNP
jgi:arylsulfatase A-like enzyme/Flp pilus assembly protein TadD